MLEWLMLEAIGAQSDKQEVERLEREGRVQEAANLKFANSKYGGTAWIVIGVAVLLASFLFVSMPVFGLTLAALALLAIAAGIAIVRYAQRAKEKYLKDAEKHIGDKQ